MKFEQRTFKNSLGEHAIVHRRLLLALCAVALALLALSWRYYHLQVVEHEKYRTQSHENRVHLQRLAPRRGLVFDREHRLVAENNPSYMLVVYRDQVEDIEQTLADLLQVQVIDLQEHDAFFQRMNQYRIFEATPVRLNLDEQAMAQFVARAYLFPGVQIKASLMRHYPQGQYIAHMLGYIGRINESERASLDKENYAVTEYMGKIGIERFYETQLHGEVGYEYVETNARGKVLRTLDTVPSVPGKDVTLHLDIDLQQAAFEILGGNRGAIVALESKTGGVLAAVSTPSYDPNLFSQRISYTQYQALNEDLDLPLFNRVLQAQYPPGSTIKPFVGLAALEARVVSMSSKVQDPGWFQLPNDERLYRDWKRTGHGEVDFALAMAQSCDVYYYDLANRLGIEAMHTF